MYRSGLSGERGKSRRKSCSKRSTKHKQKTKGKPYYLLLLTLLPANVIPWLIPGMIAPAKAESARLGVVKGKHNERQWLGIINRLKATRINYCVVDLSSLPQNLDSANVAVLFLPNVEMLDGGQVKGLATWMSKGGQIIASGPVGSLSQPQVRSQLRSLLGAYWGFPLSSPSSLNPVTLKQQQWAQQAPVSANFMGGVIIPSGLNSQTAAVWQANGTPPAVVVTDKSTFLGWRWGIDTVAPPELDTAWLQAVLTRHKNVGGRTVTIPTDCISGRPATDETAINVPNFQPENPQATNSTDTGINQSSITISPEGNGTTFTSFKPLTPEETQPNQNQVVPSTNVATVQSPPEQNSTTPNTSFKPLTPEETQLNNNQPTLQNAGVKPDQPTPEFQSPVTSTTEQAIAVSTPSVKPRRNYVIAPPQITAMGQELESLIGRVEGAMLAGDAYHNSLNSSTSNNTHASNTNQAVIKAKDGLQNFQQLVQQRQYSQARQQWLEARRTLWDNYPHDVPLAQPEIRAVWLDRGTIVKAKSEADLAPLFDQFAAAGINTVFFETVNASYPIYPSEVAPEQNPLVQGWDPLKAAVKLAHDRGMELHAWVWIFAAANKRHNSLLDQPTNYLGPVLSRHPEWIITDKQSNQFHPRTKKAFFDPANEEVRSYLLSLLEEIATKYKVDGIQLDYIRYPFQDPGYNQTYGYGMASRRQFMEKTGVDPMRISPRDRLWYDWTEFRIQKVSSFVATASQNLRSKRPDLIISAAVFPMPQLDRKGRIQQNWEEWIDQEYLDLIIPMTYAPNSEKLEQIAGQLLSQMPKGSTLVLPGIRLLNVPDIITIDQVQVLRNLPTAGYALFAAENLNANLQSIFSRTQGSVESNKTAPLPHRQPFQAAFARYQALQREWDLLSANNQLLMEEKAIKDLNKQVNILAEALNNLASEPSSKNLLSAQLALFNFRGLFSNWMEKHEQVYPYQVQVWENRLATLYRLLNYGERSFP